MFLAHCFLCESGNYTAKDANGTGSKYIILPFILLLVLFSFNIFSQDYVSDTLAVRAILDSNELDTISVKNVTDSIENRIYKLDLRADTLLGNIPNKITTILPEIGNLDKLEILIFSENNFKDLPQEFTNLTILKKLSLNSNNLDEAPQEIFSLVSLKVLGFSNNNLTNIASNIGSLINLDSLFINNNNLSSLPKEIGSLYNLKFLIAFYNNISSLPEDFKNLTNLKDLYLNYNNFTDFPIVITQLVKLERLDISQNNIVNLPGDIGNLINLSYLKLQYNNIANIPPTFGNLKNLQFMPLNNNSIVTLPDSIVKLSPSLHFDIGHNHLDTNQLSDTVISWLDLYDPDWRETQTPIGINQNIVIDKKHLYLGYNPQKSLIHFSLPTQCNVSIEIYDLKGNIIKKISTGFKSAGEHSFQINKKEYGSGVYFIKLSTNGSDVSKKITIIK